MRNRTSRYASGYTVVQQRNSYATVWNIDSMVRRSIAEVYDLGGSHLDKYVAAWCEPAIIIGYPSQIQQPAVLTAHNFTEDQAALRRLIEKAVRFLIHKITHTSHAHRALILYIYYAAWCELAIILLLLAILFTISVTSSIGEELYM